MTLVRTFAAGRWWRLWVALLLGLAGLSVPTPALAADASTACTQAGNVWVVVNYLGSVRSGCATSPSSGMDALSQVFSVDQSAGFVDRIGGNPKVTDPNRVRYWNYFHGSVSNGEWSGWSYSQKGALPYHPKPGTYEGWVYGETGVSVGWQPSLSAPATTAAPPATVTVAPAPQPPAGQPQATQPPATRAAGQPATTAPPATDSRTTAGTPPATGAATTAVTTAPAASGTPPPTPEATPSTTGAPATAAPSVVAGGVPGGSATAANPTSHVAPPAPSGTPRATLLTLSIVAVALLGGGGWYLSRLRRRP